MTRPRALGWLYAWGSLRSTAHFYPPQQDNWLRKAVSACGREDYRADLLVADTKHKRCGHCERRMRVCG